MELSEKVKTYRLENKITQKELAEKIGVSRSNIAEIEAGRIKGTMKFLNKLSEVSNTPLSYWTSDLNSDNISYRTYESLDILINSMIETGIIGEDGKLSEVAQKLVLNVLEKEIALKIKNMKGK